jgi:hypothetical protein
MIFLSLQAAEAGALPEEAVVLQLTHDHKPDREDETRRIEARALTFDLKVNRLAATGPPPCCAPSCVLRNGEGGVAWVVKR